MLEHDEYQRCMALLRDLFAEYKNPVE